MLQVYICWSSTCSRVVCRIRYRRVQSRANWSFPPVTRRTLRTAFLDELERALPDGCRRETIPAEIASPYIVHLLFSGGRRTYQGAILTRIMAKFGASIASGSACDAETGTPSRVLTAMGLSRDEAYSAVRVSFFDQNTTISTGGTR